MGALLKIIGLVMLLVGLVVAIAGIADGAVGGLLFGVALALIGGYALIAGSKEESGSGGGSMAATIGSQAKVCPDCAEQVNSAARKCRFCGFTFDEATIPVVPPAKPVFLAPRSCPTCARPMVPRAERGSRTWRCFNCGLEVNRE